MNNFRKILQFFKDFFKKSILVDNNRWRWDFWPCRIGQRQPTREEWHLVRVEEDAHQVGNQFETSDPRFVRARNFDWCRVSNFLISRKRLIRYFASLKLYKGVITVTLAVLLLWNFTGHGAITSIYIFWWSTYPVSPDYAKLNPQIRSIRTYENL